MYLKTLRTQIAQNYTDMKEFDKINDHHCLNPIGFSHKEKKIELLLRTLSCISFCDTFDSEIEILDMISIKGRNLTYD